MPCLRFLRLVSRSPNNSADHHQVPGWRDEGIRHMSYPKDPFFSTLYLAFHTLYVSMVFGACCDYLQVQLILECSSLVESFILRISPLEVCFYRLLQQRLCLRMKCTVLYMSASNATTCFILQSPFSDTM